MPTRRLAEATTGGETGQVPCAIATGIVIAAAASAAAKEVADVTKAAGTGVEQLYCIRSVEELRSMEVVKFEAICLRSWHGTQDVV